MEEVRNEVQECEPVQLEPFIHQVGGHSSILCLDERTVCKPLIKQELKFYETLPNSMKKFTPEYRGIVRVRFEEDPDGYITVAAFPPKSFRFQLPSKKKSKRRRIRVKNSGSIEIEIESELKDLFVAEDGVAAAAAASSPGSTSASSGNRASHNPWVLKCHRDNLTKWTSRSSTKEKEPPGQKFVLLENLTWRFEYPCVLDLKMGTRQYGDDATPAKIESQIAKAASSTSGQLGVRICGMQIYQTTTGKFLCRNKYYGRKLGVDGFREGLTEFLHNGNRLRIDAVAPLVEKLLELKAVLSTLDTFRFYTSSLLLIYEGLDPELCGDDELDDDNIENNEDNSKSSSADIITEIEDMDTGSSNSDDYPLLPQPLPPQPPPLQPLPQSKSIDNFKERTTTTTTTTIKEDTGTNTTIGFIEKIVQHHGGGPGSSTPSANNSTETLQQISTTPSGGGSTCSGSSNKSSRCNLTSRGSTPSSCIQSIPLPRECIDVRLIDFAHATHSGLDLGHCAKEHAGPDTGFIFGLSNLIQTLQEIVGIEVVVQNQVSQI